MGPPFLPVLNHDRHAIPRKSPRRSTTLVWIRGYLLTRRCKPKGCATAGMIAEIWGRRISIVAMCVVSVV